MLLTDAAARSTLLGEGSTPIYRHECTIFISTSTHDRIDRISFPLDKEKHVHHALSVYDDAISLYPIPGFQSETPRNDPSVHR